MRVLVLGHKGMLGNAVSKYLNEYSKHEVLTITERYPAMEFWQQVKETTPDFIVNCIGAIPQKKPSVNEYRQLNDELPRQLDELDIPIIHPSTDCEFSGSLPLGERYAKDHERDASDDYGQSKALVSKWIENESKNTKMIRTSIVGHEINGVHSLLNWFLSQKDQVNGYIDQYWSGVTTLEWAKECASLIDNWDKTSKITQIASPECVSKYDLLELFKEVYDRDVAITPIASGKPSNKCLLSDKPLTSIKDQLTELRQFYGS